MSEVRALAINAMLSQRISETELMVEDKARELILPLESFDDRSYLKFVLDLPPHLL